MMSLKHPSILWFACLLLPASLFDPSMGAPHQWKVFYSNLRTASIFASEERLERYGSGKHSFSLERTFAFERLYPPTLHRTTHTLLPVARHLMALVPFDRSSGMGRSATPSSINATLSHPSTLRIIVADEYCDSALSSIPFATGSTVFRNYWSDGLIPTTLPSNSPVGRPAAASHHQRYLPLGPRSEFQPVSAEEDMDATQRGYLFNMMATLQTNPERTELHQRLKVLISESASREDPSGGVSAALPSLSSGFIHNSQRWRLKLPTQVRPNENLPAEEYRRVLLGSVFTLCPAGHSIETFRLFEAAEAGSIPIVRFTHNSANCSSPWRPFRDVSAPFVWLEDWATVGDTLRKLQANPGKVLTMQAELRSWYHRFMRMYFEDLESELDKRTKTQH